MVPSKYADVRRFYVQKYGARIGALKFQVYLMKRQRKPLAAAGGQIKKRTSRFRINILKF
jgi:hypothetical protein